MVENLGKTAKDKIKTCTAKKIRSRAYPALPLAAAIKAAKKIYDNLGNGPHLRETLSRGLGYASFSGAVSSKIGALVQFDFLVRQSGRYSITDAARAVFEYPARGAGDIARSALRPPLYRALAARFAGESLPKDIAAILALDYGISKKAAPDAAMNFAKTMEFAGIFENGCLVLPETAVRKDPGDLPNGRGENENFEIGANENESRGKARYFGGEKIEINLDSGVAVIFPKSLASRLAMGEFAPELKSLENKTKGVE